ncbi:hypothetical protein STEG23_024277 [Scotinomys teguina]
MHGTMTRHRMTRHPNGTAPRMTRHPNDTAPEWHGTRMARHPNGTAPEWHGNDTVWTYSIDFRQLVQLQLQGEKFAACICYKQNKKHYRNSGVRRGTHH